MRDPSTVELRHLRTFLVVADTLNFTRASERLGISQPSVSLQVKELESALGAQLFSRMGPRIALTPAGRAFQFRAKIVVDRMNDACQAVADTEGLVAGHVALAVIPPLNVSWMPRVLGRVAREHPGVAVRLVEKSADLLEGTIESGRCDLGVGILSRSSPNLEYETLREDRLVLVTPPDGPFARRRKVKAEEVGGTRLVGLPETYVLHQLTAQAFRDARVLPRIAMEVDTIDALLATVVEGGLCTLMPRVVLEGRESLGLRTVALDGWGVEVELGIVWPGGGVSEPVDLLARILRETVEEKRR